MRSLQHIMRRLARAPLFTAVTLVTLAIGIGANSAIFSVINAVLLKPLPYPEPDGLVGVWHTAAGLNLKNINMSPSLYFIYREESRTFQDIGMWRSESASVTGLAEPEQVMIIRVSDGTLPILGVQPVLGRWFTRKDDSPGSPDTVILSHEYWQRKFGGNRSAIGRRIMIDGKAREIIGVMPRRFRLLDRATTLLLPFQFDRNKIFQGNFSYQAVARLKPGVTLEQANADEARMLPMVFDRFPAPPGFSAKMFQAARMGPNVRPFKQDMLGDVGSVLWVLMGTIGLVLLIACANVANLLLVRAEGRQQELAIRAALGAGWIQIARELLLESLTLAMFGGILGLGFAYGAVRLLIALAPANLPRLDQISVDAPVLLFTAAVSLLAGCLFGLVPVLKYAGAHLGTALRAGGRTLSQSRERHRARSALVVVQVTLALVLLISAGLMIRTFYALNNVQPGFTAPAEVLTFRLAIPEAEVKDGERAIRMFQDMLRKTAEIPGVSSAALTNSITMSGNTSNDVLFAQDRNYVESQVPPIRRFKFISPGFFQTVGRPLLAGRDLTWTDIYARRPVALISENLAREYWHDPAGAIGKRIREGMKDDWREIIGVVKDERDDGVNQKAPATVYWPILMSKFWGDDLHVQRNLTIAIRSTRTGSSGLLDQIQRAVWSVDPDVPLAEVRTLQEIYQRSMARTSFTLVMLAIAGAMALLLGLIGIYGVISYSVSQRTREIGIRLALGAQEQTVTQMFIRHALVLSGIGTMLGLTAAAGLMRLMKSLLFEISPVDPATYGAVALALLLAATFASYLPARRATAVDPVETLRSE